MSYSLNQRIKLVWFYAETKSVSLTQKKFKEHFHLTRREKGPGRQCILNLVDKFLKTGSVHDTVRCGRQKTGRSTNNIDVIRRVVEKSPKRSVRRLSAENQVKKSTVHRILRKDLKKYPFKIQIKQKIKAAYRQSRLEFLEMLTL